MSSEDPKAFYDKQLQGIQYAAETGPAHAGFAMIKDFVEAFALQDKHCLEVGCGRGAFQYLVKDYVGTDLSDSVRPYLHKEFYQCDARQLPFDDDAFDAIWTVNVFEHVPDPEAGLREMCRVLRPGGVLCLAPNWHTRAWLAQGYTVRPWSDFDLRGKMVKLTIPLREFWLLRWSIIVLRRIARVCAWVLKGRRPIPLRYKGLVPNYDHFWMPDSDAANSLDQLDALLWFMSRGYQCDNVRGLGDALFFRRWALVVRKPRNCG